MLLKKQEKRKCKKCGVNFLTQTATHQCLECRSLGKSTKKVIAPARTIQKRKKRKKTLYEKLKENLDEIFSKYIRQKYSIDGENVECVTCHKVKPIKEMQCGHYVGRANMNTRYSEKNCFPQCYGCNVKKHGNYVKFTEFIINKFGMVYLKNLLAEGNMIKKWTEQDLQERIDYYKNLIK